MHKNIQVAVKVAFSVAIVGALVLVGTVPAGALWSMRGEASATVQTDRLHAPPPGKVVENSGESLVFNVENGGQQSETLPTVYALERATTEDFTDSALIYQGESTQITDTGSSHSDSLWDVQYTDIAVGSAASCGIGGFGGGVWCWGDNSLGQLGQGHTTGFSATPLRVQTSADNPLSDLPEGSNMNFRISSGADMMCAYSSRDMWCWGAAVGVQFGIPDDTSTVVRSLPQRIEGLPLSENVSISAVSVGGAHICVLMSANVGLYCFGRGDNGRLGTGNQRHQSVPQRVVQGGASQLPANVRVSEVVAGADLTCVIPESRMAVYCAGQNRDGGLGNGTTTDSAYMRGIEVAGSDLGSVAGSVSFRHVMTGSTGADRDGFRGSVCVLVDREGAFCWGSGAHGALGTGNTRSSPLAQRVLGLPRGEWSWPGRGSTLSSCARNASALYCWGANGSGQLGVGHAAAALTAVMVPIPAGQIVFQESSSGGSDPDAVIQGLGTRCWRFSDGTLGCVGRGTNGALGEGDEGRLGSVNSTIGQVITPRLPVCAAGAVAWGERCVLVPGRVYFYRLSYTIGEWQSPLSRVFRVETVTPRA
ncbi:hypothetical protein [Lysinibacter sp. HNR]|uniref:RCC1 domain-containing protein n=1 Tax=Lysinibacter sp. HNR TaxID=3031408 RepID=UPI0024354D29|nr:hypothetical protein [Lysinibacter sp. HNR]WGD37464.1 hypothetical protein FrondiHNR_00645 [Lysinibacter sp. HNR]